VSLLLRQTCGPESRGAVHVSLHANDAPAPQIEDGRRVDHKLDPALAALEFAVENNHPVAGVDEPHRLDAVLIPNLVVLSLEALSDLVRASADRTALSARLAIYKTTLICML